MSGHSTSRTGSTSTSKYDSTWYSTSTPRLSNHGTVGEVPVLTLVRIPMLQELIHIAIVEEQYSLLLSK